jgi:ethanolamine phosphate phosphodiesterase
VDPHTYPDRPWPLSTLTVLHTDLYLRRSFSFIQQTLHPDTAFFLGDLFDGGREWATSTSESPEGRYKRYGENFWLREYSRFCRIFFDHWGDGGMNPNNGQRGRKIIASLPGNHDLGLGVGIQLAVRDRFTAFFGEGNRVDIIGNHTFVSVDVVSLSAKNQPGSEHVNPEQSRKLWKPVEEFLNGVKAAKRRAVAAEIRHQNGGFTSIRHEHIITDASDPAISAKPPTLDPGEGAPEFPTILLTHVPLYRPDGTPCGPLREHWPPSPPPKGQTTPLKHDERNAIAVRQGYQYQNVLQPEISKNLVEMVGNVGYVFSGDDHDYCEVFHKGYTGSPFTGAIREITVKSISWAMGVRKPGFLLLSLWNPVDPDGNPLGSERGGGEPGRKTVQTHLCLLPDQLAIFIRYACLIGVTVSALLIRAFLVAFFNLFEPFSQGPSIHPDSPLLPTTNPINSLLSSAEHEKSEFRGRYYYHQHQHSQTSSDSSTASSNTSQPPSGGLSVRNQGSRARGLSPGGGFRFPLSPLRAEEVEMDEGGFKSKSIGRRWSRGVAEGAGVLFLRETVWSVWRVAWVVFIWYGWLAWKG